MSTIEYHKQQMQLAREGMAKGIKYSSRRLGGHTTQYRRLCRLAGIPVIVKTTIKVSPVIGKPCRYKACKGRNHKAHGEKCPVASEEVKQAVRMVKETVKRESVLPMVITEMFDLVAVL